MKRLLLVASLALLASPGLASASVTLLEKDDWKVQMSGFVELDMYRDSTRAFTEGPGNGAVPRTNTFDGDNSRFQSSIRNSRLAFTILPPLANEWKSKGYLEFDLLGYEPSVSSAAPKESESAFYTNATMRVRHAYFNAEKNGWSLLAGQYWTLFGWGPTYVVTTESVPPGPGMIYQRTPQLTLMKTLSDSDVCKTQVGVSLTRPSQRDSSMPNLDVGAKYSYSRLVAGFASPSGDVSAQPASIALSGTMRQFSTPASNAATPDESAGMKKTTGTAVALDLMVPVLPSRDGKDVSNTITVTGEYTTGKGYADAFPSFTGGMAQFPNGTTGAASAANVDAGQGSFDSNGAFQLLKLQSWNIQVQYHLPAEIGFVTAGHSELAASGYDGLTPAVTYDKSKMDFVNFFHDFTPQIRGAVEFARFTTHYVAQGDEMKNDRIGVSGFFRF